MSLEMRAARWVRSRLGDSAMQPKERALRILEEAIELAQAEGISPDQSSALMAHVYQRPAGTPAREAAGVATCLLAWCAAAGHEFTFLATAEMERNERKSDSRIAASVARKTGAGLIAAPPAADLRGPGGEK